MALPDFPRPLATVDLAIFSIRDGGLFVLLVKRPADAEEPFPGRWALPGGFVDVGVDRDLEACATRKLREKTGFMAPYLEQVGSWGNARRDPRGWSATHLYFALAPGNQELPAGSGGSWRAIEGNGAGVRLAFDHERLLEAAVTRLRAKVEYTSLPAYLIPEPFTLAELQRAFEVVLGRAVNKAAFRTRILSSGLVESTGKQRDGPTRPAGLYRRAARDGDLTYFPRPLSPRD